MYGEQLAVCTVNSVKCAVYNEQWAVCTVYSKQCTVYRIERLGMMHEVIANCGLNEGMTQGGMNM